MHHKMRVQRLQCKAQVAEVQQKAELLKNDEIYSVLQHDQGKGEPYAYSQFQLTRSLERNQHKPSCVVEPIYSKKLNNVITLLLNLSQITRYISQAFFCIGNGYSALSSSSCHLMIQHAMCSKGYKQQLKLMPMKLSCSFSVLIVIVNNNEEVLRSFK